MTAPHGVSDIEILDQINFLTKKHGFPPTVRELGVAVGINSSASIHSRLKSLRHKGLVTWIDESPRTLRIVKGDSVDAE